MCILVPLLQSKGGQSQGQCQVLTNSIYLKPLHFLAHLCLHWDNEVKHRLPESDNEYKQMGQWQEQKDSQQKWGHRAIYF